MLPAVEFAEDRNMRHGAGARRPLWVCLPLMLALACAKSHVVEAGPDAGPQDGGAARDGAVWDVSVRPDRGVRPDVGPPDLGAREDVGPLVCGPITARVYIESSVPTGEVVLGEGPDQCSMVGIRVDDEAAATLSALPGVSCAYWYFFDGVLCDIRTSWDDPDQLDWCWLDTVAGGQQDWACVRFLD
jgi:hypothetical protein